MKLIKKIVFTHVRTNRRFVPLEGFFMNICVFGASNDNIDPIHISAAQELGARLASSGIGLVFGAGRTGVMGAAARGAFAKGGTIIGVIPKKLNVKGIYFENCTELLVTETMHERKALMESLSDGFVALSGGFGTIEEFMEVLTLKQLDYFRSPLVLFNMGGFYDGLIAQLQRCVDDGFTNKLFMQLFSVANTVDEAMELLCAKGEAAPMPDKIAEVLKSSEMENNV